MLSQKTSDSYTQPQYTILQPVSKDASANFLEEMKVFLSQHPEFTSTRSHLEFLCYCFDYYIDCDPVSKDLPPQEKLRQAGEEAKKLMSFVIGA